MSKTYKINIDTDNGTIAPDVAPHDILISQEFDGRNVNECAVFAKEVSAGSFTVLPVIECDPTKAKNWSRVGNATDKDRQSYIFIDAEGSGSPKIAMYSEVDSYQKYNAYSNLRVLIGKLDDIEDPLFPEMKGMGLLTDNCYLRGDFILRNGKDVGGLIDLRVEKNDVINQIMISEEEIKINGSKITIGNFKIDNTYMYTGEEPQETDDYDPNGLTIGNSSIRAKEFFLGSDGSAHFKGVLEAPSGNLGGFSIVDNTLKSNNDVMILDSSADDPHLLFKTTYKDSAGLSKVGKIRIDTDSVVFHGQGDIDQDVVSFINVHSAGIQSFTEDARADQIVTGMYARAINYLGTAYSIFSDGVTWTRNIEMMTLEDQVSGTDAQNPFGLDTSKYGHFSLDPVSSTQYISLDSGRTSRRATIVNRDDDRSLVLINTVAGDNSFTISGGSVVELICDTNDKYNGSTQVTTNNWFVLSIRDHNW